MNNWVKAARRSNLYEFTSTVKKIPATAGINTQRRGYTLMIDTIGQKGIFSRIGITDATIKLKLLQHQ